MGLVKDVQAWLDKRPIVFCFVLILLAFPLVGAGTLIRPAIALAAQRQGASGRPCLASSSRG